MRKNKISISILFLIIVIILTGCSNQESSNDDNKEKVVQELDYLDTHIVSIINKLNNINLDNYNVTSEEINLQQQSSSSGSSSGSSQSSSGGGESGDSQSSGGQEGGGQQGGSQSGGSEQQGGNSQEKSNITTTQMQPKTILETDENDIDWNAIKSEIETINSSWGIILLDLSNLNVDNNDVLSFSSTLDDCILSIKDENKKDSIANLSKLYSFIPKYETSISAENSKQNIKQVKSYLINAYTAVEEDNWSNVETNITECEKAYKNIVNDVEYVKDKEFKVNRTYVLMKELQNSLSYKDKKLFYVKYKNLLESINTLK